MKVKVFFKEGGSDEFYRCLLKYFRKYFRMFKNLNIDYSEVYGNVSYLDVLSSNESLLKFIHIENENSVEIIPVNETVARLLNRFINYYYSKNLLIYLSLDGTYIVPSMMRPEAGGLNEAAGRP